MGASLDVGASGLIPDLAATLAWRWTSQHPCLGLYRLRCIDSFVHFELVDHGVLVDLFVWAGRRTSFGIPFYLGQSLQFDSNGVPAGLAAALGGTQSVCAANQYRDRSFVVDLCLADVATYLGLVAGR